MNPFTWTGSAEAARFFARLSAARRSVLMLDYDGTLAPFKNDPLTAWPYPGIEERLAALASLPRVHLVLVSGRPARGLAELLGSTRGPASALKLEIWGDHGRERLAPDGTYEFIPLDPPEKETLERIKFEIGMLGFAKALEVKPASAAIHWRGLEPGARQQIRSMVETLYARHAGESKLRLIPFDGGLELRSKSHDKGAAVEQILAEETASGDLVSAYLGDDLTDEDAFRALGDRGGSILVRREPRPSSARFWIRPPEELLNFLDQWIHCSSSPLSPLSNSSSNSALKAPVELGKSGR